MVSNTKKLISIIVPVYNERPTLHVLFGRLTEIFKNLNPNYEIKVVFIDDGSKDDSWEIIKGLAKKDRRFSGIKLSRNFGHQAALTCGYNIVQGDAIITIDADLQDPPEVMIEMIQKWEKGSKVVLGVRRKRFGDSIFKLWTAKVYYKLINKLSETRSTEEAGDFRLLDRMVVDTLNKIDERHRYIRGLVEWIGFQIDFVEYERVERFAGKSKYNLIKMIRLAMDGIVSFSFIPLRIAYILSFFLMLPFLLYLLYNLFLRYYYEIEMVPGWSSLILAIIIFGMFNLLMLGLLGEYIGRIYTEVKKRPMFIINEYCGDNHLLDKEDNNLHASISE